MTGDNFFRFFSVHMNVGDLRLAGLINLNDRLETADADAACLCDDRVLDACYQGDIGGQVAQSLEPPIECAPDDLIARR